MTLTNTGQGPSFLITWPDEAYKREEAGLLGHLELLFENFLVNSFVFLLFEVGSHCVAQASLELWIPLPHGC